MSESILDNDYRLHDKISCDGLTLIIGEISESSDKMYYTDLDSANCIDPFKSDASGASTNKKIKLLHRPNNATEYRPKYKIGHIYATEKTIYEYLERERKSPFLSLSSIEFSVEYGYVYKAPTPDFDVDPEEMIDGKDVKKHCIAILKNDVIPKIRNLKNLLKNDIVNWYSTENFPGGKNTWS